MNAICYRVSVGVHDCPAVGDGRGTVGAVAHEARRDEVQRHVRVHVLVAGRVRKAQRRSRTSGVRRTRHEAVQVAIANIVLIIPKDSRIIMQLNTVGVTVL